jgi:hypothetical protein
MRRLPAPPSPHQWALDAELRGGHTVQETLQYAAWCQDYADEVAAARHLPNFVITALPETRLSAFIRRVFQR